MKMIPSGVTRTVGRQILIARKNSPQLMFVGGILGVGTSTFMACKATLKLSDQLDKMKSEMVIVKEMRDDETKTDVGDRDVAYIYAKNLARVARLYAPAAIVGFGSVGLLTGSHITLQRRNVGLTAAYAAAIKTLDEYRDRVKEELGEERENDIYEDMTTVKIKNEDGTTKKYKVPGGPSLYARYYDETARGWERNPEANRGFIEVQQKHANDLLRARGHIFLNEIYDMLGFERSKAGQVVGWIWDPTDETRDNRVDFNLYGSGNERFINCLDPRPLLDFNVDGVIYDLI